MTDSCVEGLGSELRSLVDCDVRVADDAAPLVALALRVFGESFRRSAYRLRALIDKLLAYFGCGEDGVDPRLTPVVAISSGWPSGAERATASAPKLPAAPGRFSITTGWPSTPESRSPRSRATMWVDPPAANGTTMRTGFCGYRSCAPAPPAESPSATSRASAFFIVRSVGQTSGVFGIVLFWSTDGILQQTVRRALRPMRPHLRLRRHVPR